MKPGGLLRRLQAVRAGGALIEELKAFERPASVAMAYDIAARLTQGEAVAGYKIGATSEAGRRLLKLRQPFYGRILARTLQRSPATVRSGVHGVAAEPEVGLELGTPLRPRRKPYTRGEVAAAVRRVLPLIEFNAPSFRDPFACGGLCLIADNGVNAGAVVGQAGITRLDVIAQVQVRVTLDGREHSRGTAMAAPDDPLSSLCWLANTLAAHGVGLESGQIVASGALTAALHIRGECSLEADFGALGAVQVAFMP